MGALFSYLRCQLKASTGVPIPLAQHQVVGRAYLRKNLLQNQLDSSRGDLSPAATVVDFVAARATQTHNSHQVP